MPQGQIDNSQQPRGSSQWIVRPSPGWHLSAGNAAFCLIGPNVYATPGGANEELNSNRAARLTSRGMNKHDAYIM